MSSANSGTAIPRTRVAPGALEQIRRHAAEVYPDECCGALIGRDSDVLEAYALPNAAEDGRRRRFRITPSDYLRSEARARAMNARLVGFYHSHPDHPARPSSHDLEQAWPNLTYVIVEVRGGAAGEITAWRLRDDRSGFDGGEL